MDQVITFWDENICNLRYSNEEIASKKFFEEVTKKKYFVEKHIPSFAEFSKYRGKRVLEVGCGIGTAMQSFVENGAIYKGIDVSKKSLEIARKRLDVFNLEATLEERDIQTYQTDERYDLIYGFGIFHHIPNINKALENVHSLLKDDGEFKLMLYASNSWKKFRINDKIRTPSPFNNHGWLLLGNKRNAR